MESSVGGMLVLGVMLAAVLLLFRVFIVSNSLIASALQQQSTMTTERLDTSLRHEYAASDGSNLRVDLSNEGSTSVSDYSSMDMIVSYRSVGGAIVQQRLTYVSASPGNDQWTDRFRTPDVSSPGLWDPGEKLKLLAVLGTAHATSTRGTVSVASPNGASAAGSFSTASWVTLADTPDTHRDGAALATDGTHIYALRGSNNSDFWRYDVVADSWTALADTPSAVDDGSALVHASGYVYALRANVQTDFWRYNILGDSWETLAVTPTTTEWGAALTWDGSNTIYAFRGNDTNNFWEYSISGDVWTSTLAVAPATVRWGGALAYVAGDVYAFRGNLDASFWSYSVSGDSWSTTPPADAPDTVKRGGALVWDGDDYIYALRGSNTNSYWRYSITSDSWKSQAITPSPVDDGGALIYLDGDIYALEGGNNARGFWKFRAPDF